MSGSGKQEGLTQDSRSSTSSDNFTRAMSLNVPYTTQKYENNFYILLGNILEVASYTTQIYVENNITCTIQKNEDKRSIYHSQI